MRARSESSLLAGVVTLILFICFTAEIKLIGVEAVGPENSSVGLAALNSFAARKTGVSPFWHELGNALGYTALVVVAVIACIGAYQLIKGRGIKAVDRKVLLFGAFCIVLLAVFLFFGSVHINYGPILVNGELRPSYPSFGMLLAICVFVSIALLSSDLPVFGAQKRPLTAAVCIIAAAGSLAGSMLSGFSWFTDVAGGAFLSASLLYFFEAARRELCEECSPGCRENEKPDE